MVKKKKESREANKRKKLKTIHFTFRHIVADWEMIGQPDSTRLERT